MHFLHSASGNMKTTQTIPIHARFRAIREAKGLTQELFLPVLRKAAIAVLGDGGRAYSQSTLSRLESGRQAPTFDDVAVWAEIDPEGRGKLWLAWEEAVDATLARPKEKEEPRARKDFGTIVAGSGAAPKPSVKKRA